MSFWMERLTHPTDRRDRGERENPIRFPSVCRYTFGSNAWRQELTFVCHSFLFCLFRQTGMMTIFLWGQVRN